MVEELGWEVAELVVQVGQVVYLLIIQHDVSS